VRRAGFRTALQNPVVGGTVGILGLILIWTVCSTLLPSSVILPTPWAAVGDIVDSATRYYLPNLGVTLERAAQGYLWGNLAGLACAALVLLIPKLEEIVTQLGVISQCLPITAVGPIIVLMFGGDTTSIFLSALLVFFTTMVGAILGLRSTGKTVLDVVDAYGGNRFTRIRKVQLIGAVPAVFTALKIAVPGAILGAVVGEYLGGIDNGVGVALAAAQREQSGDRVWALSIVAGLVSLLGYGLVGLIGRWATPWSRTARRGGGN
jgi:ABC-type nitrate/sulfonate/bicarbonate transport system permease component